MPIQSAKNILSFINEARKNPNNVGAITPSSRFLANSIANKIPHKFNQSIVELGSGTGIVSKAIIKRDVVKHHNLHLVELSEPLCKILKHTFKDSNILNISATDIGNHIEPNSVDIIISCLPFKIFSKELTESIIEEAHKTLKHNGVFIRFSYDLIKDIDVITKKFKQKDSELVWRNIPPAIIRVYNKH